MFKRAVNKFFEWKFTNRFFVIALIIAVLLFGYATLFQGLINALFFPDEGVYSHFSQLATDIIREKNTDFLENSDIVKYYTIAENSQENTITVCLHGHSLEELKIVLSTDYNLLSVDNRHSHTGLLVIVLIFSYVYCLAVGALYSFCFNAAFIGLKYAYEHWFIKYWPRICEYFRKLYRNKKTKSKVVAASRNKSKFAAVTEVTESEPESESDDFDLDDFNLDDFDYNLEDDLEEQNEIDESNV